MGKRWLTLLFVVVMQANVLLHHVLHFAYAPSTSSDQFDVPHVAIAHLCDCAPSFSNGDGCDPNVAGAASFPSVGINSFCNTQPDSLTKLAGKTTIGLALARAPPSIVLV